MIIQIQSLYISISDIESISDVKRNYDFLLSFDFNTIYGGKYCYRVQINNQITKKYFIEEYAMLLMQWKLYKEHGEQPLFKRYFDSFPEQPIINELCKEKDL